MWRVQLGAWVALTFTLVTLTIWPTQTLAADASTPTRLSHGAAEGDSGKLVPKFTTENSDTYQLPNGHMLTRVFTQAVNQRTPAGGWEQLPAGTDSNSASNAPQSNATPAAESRGPGAADELACTILQEVPTASECNTANLRAGFFLEKNYDGDAGVHALLHFPMPELHGEVTVLNADLELYETASTTTSKVAMGAYRLTTPWESGVTWNTTDGSTPWSTPGGDFVSSGEREYVENQSVGTAAGWLYWYPTQTVQQWINGSDAPSGEGAPNLGFLMKDVHEYSVNNIVTFAGHEQPDYPGLSFEWVRRGIGTATNYTMIPGPTSSTTSTNVNAASGNLMVQSTDLTIQSKAMPFSVARTFNSLAPDAPGYGSGWADDNTPSVQVGPNGSSGPDGSVLYTDPTGNTFIFFDDRTTTPGIEATMCEAGIAGCPATLPSGATYELEYTASGRKLYFAGNAGRNFPLSIGYAGETTIAHYTTGLELPTSWTDSLNETINYTESATKGYSKVEDATSKASIVYAEKTDKEKLYKLTTVTNAAKEKTTYAYGTGPEEGLLAEIAEPDGGHVRFSYDESGRLVKLVNVPAGQSQEETTSYTYYEPGAAPEPCTAQQQAMVLAKSPEEATVYCANVLDEVEKVEETYADTKPPVFEDFEAAAFDETTTGPTIIYFGEAEDPPLPNGKPGSGVEGYWYRYSVSGKAFSAWAQAGGGEVEVPHIGSGKSFTIEVYADDYAGNKSATVTASGVVPRVGEGGWIGPEDTEEDPTLNEEFAPEAEGYVLNASEGDTEEGEEFGEGDNKRVAKPLFTELYKHSKITKHEIVRNGYQQFAIGNAEVNESFDVKGQANHEYYGEIYGHLGVCGWLFLFATKYENSNRYGECPNVPPHEMKPTKFAELINCAKCEESTWVKFRPEHEASGKPKNTDVPVYDNVRPFATHEQPAERFTSVETVNSKHEINRIPWRYITKSGKWALVSVKYPKNKNSYRWAFIEAKWLPAAGTPICGTEPELHPKISPGWPKTCEIGTPNK